MGAGRWRVWQRVLGAAAETLRRRCHSRKEQAHWEQGDARRWSKAPSAASATRRSHEERHLRAGGSTCSLRSTSSKPGTKMCSAAAEPCLLSQPAAHRRTARIPFAGSQGRASCAGMPPRAAEVGSGSCAAPPGSGGSPAAADQRAHCQLSPCRTPLLHRHRVLTAGWLADTGRGVGRITSAAQAAGRSLLRARRRAASPS